MIVVFGGTGRSGSALREQVDGKFLGSSDCDLRSLDSVKECLNHYHPDQVIHLAATCGSSNKNRSYEYFYDNILMGINIFHECIQRNIRLVAISSSAAYHSVGTPKEGELHDAAPDEYNFSYAFAKRSLDAHRRASGYDNCIILYPSNMYGPHDSFGEGCHVIPSLLGRMREQDHVTVQNCDSVRQFMYFEDLAKAIALVLEDGQINGELNVVPKESHSIREVALNLSDVIGYRGRFTFQKGGDRKVISSEKFMEKFPGFRFTKLSDGLRGIAK